MNWTAGPLNLLYTTKSMYVYTNGAMVTRGFNPVAMAR